MTIRLALVLLVFFIAAPVVAQHCTPDMTLDGCEAAVMAAMADEAAPSATLVGAAALAQQQQVQEENRVARADRLSSKLSPEIGSLPGSSAVIEDFLAKLKISATTVELSESGGEALAVDLTDFLGLETKHGYKVQAVLRPA
jgi:hypothetical protein